MSGAIVVGGAIVGAVVLVITVIVLAVLLSFPVRDCLFMPDRTG